MLKEKALESAKQSKNISRSEFLPSITLSGDQNSSTSTNRTNQNGANLQTLIQTQKVKLFLLNKKYFQVLKV